MTQFMARDCEHCGRCFATTKGIFRHMLACNGRKRIPRWKWPRARDERSVSGARSRYNNGYEWTDSSKDTQCGDEGMPEEPNQYIGAGDVPPEYADAAYVTRTVRQEENSAAFDGSDSDVSADVSPTARTLSSGAYTIVETYFDTERGSCPPGQPCSVEQSLPRPTDDRGPLRSSLPRVPLRMLHPDYFTPFQSLAEYELAHWLFKSQTTAGNMKKFFESSMEPWHHLSRIKTVEMWKQALHRIPYGIPNDGIREHKLLITLPSGRELVYSVKYRPIMNIIRFLIGHEAFKDKLAYAPVRLYKDEDKTIPVYNEMHTGSWWWDMQKKLPPGSTIVPVILASDKTQLTQHHGDKSSWPVYVTIGNLDKSTRRSQTRPSKVLLGFLPIPSKGDDRGAGVDYYTFKRLIYNQAMAVMTEPCFTPGPSPHPPHGASSCDTMPYFSSNFDRSPSLLALIRSFADEPSALVRAQSNGVRMRCADGQTRDCFPIIGGFVADYEEQVLITGVKSGRHCVICQVHPDKREDLTPLETNPLRSHEYTQECIRALRTQSRKRKRRGETTDDSDDNDNEDASAMQVEDITSFMWRHRRSNMHEVMQVDILHQLFKGIVERALRVWVYPALVAREGGEKRADARLNERFRAIPRFQYLRIFANYSAVTQWTGVEQKALLRQLVPALAPLLPRPMIQFMRALVDFTLHAQYYSHDTDTLLWMEEALRRMDLLKPAFAEFTSAENGFNIPKLHAITHYPMMIRKFGSADGYDTSMFEAGHKFMVKEWYELTNKRETFEQQIMEHNIRAVNMLAMRDLFDYRLAENLVVGDKEDPAQVTRATRPENLDNLGWTPSSQREYDKIRTLQRRVPRRENYPHLRRGSGYWRFASTVADRTRIPDLLEALAVFVREERRRLDGHISSNIAMNQKEPECSWINSFLVCVHPSLNCWKYDRDDGTNADVRVKELVRCDPSWQTEQKWRRDSVWIQEYTDMNSCPRPLQGRLPGQLLIILTVMDHTRPLGNGTFCTYTGAFVDVYTLKNQGKQHSKHGMIEARRHPPTTDVSSRSLGHRRFYQLGLIHRSVHLVPVSSDRKDDFYINPYVDWDQYATVYHPAFLAEDHKTVEAIRKEYGWGRISS